VIDGRPVFLPPVYQLAPKRLASHRPLDRFATRLEP